MRPAVSLIPPLVAALEKVAVRNSKSSNSSCGRPLVAVWCAFRFGTPWKRFWRSGPFWERLEGVELSKIDRGDQFLTDPEINSRERICG